LAALVLFRLLLGLVWRLICPLPWLARVAALVVLVVALILLGLGRGMR